MIGTMTYVGLDLHARSTHAAALDVRTGELRRARFGGGSEEVVAWLAGLPQPLRGCYEAGPTGFALYRAAEAAGVSVECAQGRLHRLYHRLRERGKPGNLVTVAVALELACFLWAAALADSPPPQPPVRAGAGPDAAGTRA